jgi:hypothetical protein
MEEKIKILGLAILCCGLMMIVSFCGGWHLRDKQIAPPVADTIRIERVDTVTLVGNKVDTLICYVNRPYPVAVHDTMWRNDTLYVQLPYEHRYYASPDTLEVWYSGVDPKIDSINLYYHHTTEIIKEIHDVHRMPRLTLDVGAGAFYHERQVFPYAVGEMRYNAAKTTFSAYGAINHEGKWGAGAGVTYRMNIIK